VRHRTGQAGAVRRKMYRVKFWKLIFFTLFLVYPTVSRTILRTFVCKEINGNSYLITDMNVKCFEDRWNSQIIYSVIFIFLYPVGVPCAITYELWKYAKKNRLTDANVVARLGFFYGGYLTHMWWFEVLDMVHKLSVTSLIFYIPYDSGWQMRAAIIILGSYLMCILWLNPYRSKGDDRLHILAQTWLLLLCITGEIFTVDRNPDPVMIAVMTVFLIGGFCGFLTFFVGSTFGVVFKMLKKNTKVKKRFAGDPRFANFFKEKHEKKDPTHDSFYDGIEIYQTKDSTVSATVDSPFFNTEFPFYDKAGQDKISVDTPKSTADLIAHNRTSSMHDLSDDEDDVPMNNPMAQLAGDLDSD
jgi:hypothetical protein